MTYIYKTTIIDKNELRIGRGKPLPLGSNFMENGVNFSVFSSSANTVTLLLFASGKENPFVEIDLEKQYNKTGEVWHIYIEGLPQDFRYGYRTFGKFNPKKGTYHNPNKILFDPYSLALSGGALWNTTLMRDDQEYVGYRRRSFIPETNFNWGNDSHLNIPFKDTIIYELHLRGFTIDPSSEINEKGTFAGLIEKIPYLKKLGVTAVELLPIQEFDELENTNNDPETGTPLLNYWGYSTMAFFAPKASYAASGIDGKQIDEFKTLVKELHLAGIEVILDIVFNHTNEGNDTNTIKSFKGFDALTYYMINQDGEFLNYSGCGNTLNCNHPVVRNLIMDVLRYWVTEMHIDGFRFDLASILGRDEKGNVLPNPPILEQIAKDPVLTGTKIIAEAWDAAGLYQVGSFPGERWSEWNGKYRDCIKKMVKGDTGVISEFIERIMGSPDLYKNSNRHPYHSINFITSHDGFTLWDLVSYKEKHNELNGEKNKDGDNNNNSDNYGYEGPTNDSEIINKRTKQVKNFITILFLSQGTPMISAGDEFLKTQKGNNNAYCQDNKISWIDWTLQNKNQNFFEFVKEMIKFRKDTAFFKSATFQALEHDLNVSYHGIKPNNPDFSHFSRSIAVMIKNAALKENDYKKIYMAFNFWEKPLTFKLPKGDWKLKIDTDQTNSFYKNALPLEDTNYLVNPYSIVVLIENM